jgi:aerobic carbon-monoxide dehydrogenase large subunit
MRAGSILGHPVRRIEDPRLLTGEARFTEDVPAEGARHAVFVRSFMAHARLGRIDTSQARSMPGVVAVLTQEDLQLPPQVSGIVPPAFARPILATDVVRFVGEPVAVVVAGSRAQAVDAAEAVAVEYEALPILVDPRRALEPDAPMLFPGHGSNEVTESRLGSGDALEGAEVIVRARMVNQRLAPVPMEVNSTLAVPDPESGGLTLWISCQAPHWMRSAFAGPLGLEERQLRVIATAVGGGFGAKIDPYPEQLVVAALALRIGSPVRYVETRSESMVAMTHGRGQIQDVAIGAKRDGTITGLSVRLVADGGAYPGNASLLPVLTQMMACGVYRIPRVDFHSSCVATNTTPINAYRGAGRPEATALIERAIDLLAAEIGLDPAEARRRNMIRKDEFPYVTASGAMYDSGDYERALDEALRLADYEGLRREQAERRERGGKLLGIGLSCYVEVTAFFLGSEFGSVQVHPDGTVTVLAGTSPQGQGHATTFAQIVGETLGLPIEAVTVVHSDTGLVPQGGGTMGSRSVQTGGSAILRASEGLLDKARRIAAHLLEAGLDDVALLEDGRVGLVGAPDRSFGWADLAAAANDPTRLPDGIEPGLTFRANFSQEPTGSYPFGAHLAVAEVDEETGEATLVRHVAVDDCGRVINPLLVEGQVHGGIAQGAAQALYEEMVYDEDGTPLTGSLMTYGIPSAAEMPTFELASTVTPTPLNPLGAKGIGESGTIGSTPAVQNAVVDALSHKGVRHIDMPLSPERVLRAIRAIGQTYA